MRWVNPPVIPAEDKITGPWIKVGEEYEVVRKVPTVVNGFGVVVANEGLTIKRSVERRKIWQFVGYEERTVDS